MKSLKKIIKLRPSHVDLAIASKVLVWDFLVKNTHQLMNCLLYGFLLWFCKPVIYPWVLQEIMILLYLSHKDRELRNSQIWLAEINIENGADFPVAYFWIPNSKFNVWKLCLTKEHFPCYYMHFSSCKYNLKKNKWLYYYLFRIMSFLENPSKISWNLKLHFETLNLILLCYLQ